MILADAIPKSAVGQLIAALDRELALLDRRRQHMDELQQAIVKADDAAMEALLARMADADREQARVDAEVGELRTAISLILAPEDPPLRLSQLMRRLSDDQAEPIGRRRSAILQKITELRRRHVETAILLAECARINRLLLEALLGARPTVVTYDARGGHHCQTDGGWLSREI